MGKKLTNEEFLSKVRKNNWQFAKNKIEILGKYVNMRSHIHCHCKICDTFWDPTGDSLCSGKGCPVCRYTNSANTKKISYEEFIERVNSLNKGFEVIGDYIDVSHKVTIRCEKGHIWDAFPQHIFDGVGCPYCAGKKVWIGFNDLWTTRPDIAKLLLNPEDGYKYSQWSSKKRTFICPDCKNTCVKSICVVSRCGLYCNHCSDGVSYPNKFGRAFLDQLPINNHICEYHPKWAEPYFYDNYFIYNGIEYIVEFDGEQHYKECKYFKNSLAERQNIDKLKNNLAIQNGIKIIRINCIKSEGKYIKNSIQSSELSYIFDLSSINWLLCEQKAQKNLVKEACDLYMSGLKSLSDIGDKLHIHCNTVRRYLINGSKCNWCDYNIKNQQNTTK